MLSPLKMWRIYPPTPPPLLGAPALKIMTKQLLIIKVRFSSNFEAIVLNLLENFEEIFQPHHSILPVNDITCYLKKRGSIRVYE